MANVPPSNFNHISNPQQINANQGPNIVNNSQYNQMPFNQASSAIKQDANLNNQTPVPFNNVNNFQQSANSSPAFNRPILPTTSQPSPVRQPNFTLQNAPNQYVVQRNITPSNTALPPQTQPLGQINANAPPLVPSSQQQPFTGLHHPIINGPLPAAGEQLTAFQHGKYPPSSTTNGPPNSHFRPPVSNAPPNATNLTSPMPNHSSFGVQGGVNLSKPSAPPTSYSSVGQRSMPHQLNSMNIAQGVNGPPMMGPPGQSFSGPSSMPPTQMQPGLNGPPITGPPRQSFSGPSSLPPHQTHQGLNGPPPTGPPRQPFSDPSSMPPQTIHQGTNGPTKTEIPRPPISGQNPGLPQPLQQGINGPSISTQGYVNSQQIKPPTLPPSGVASFPSMGPSSLPPLQSHPGMQPPTTNFQNRYPPMQHPNNHQVPPMNSFPDQYNQGLNQQMGQLSVTKQGFDQLWGHQVVDLLQCKNILPEYPEEPPPITLTNQFADSPNCSPEIFRCTLNRIPETNSLLQKSRLPLGILIHPFKDLNHLPVIQCMSIVRCRACRTYINPFVYFVDSKRWKCNLCFRVNDLPEEFQYDPVSKSYGDPSRRPEIKSATIEFIAPGEYMLRPPQPAVYLFLLDISQLARDSGYLKIFCETLKSNLDQLPGDARTQVGFLCYDAHVHYYLLNDELTRPKEVTVIDIDDVFLPSPSCLLVNLRESRALIDELLTALPQRHCAPASPSCALGAALQAALKLMAPTGGRVSVFQTCLPNVGPGALTSREDPNARSSSDVAHLSPATDFYKRLALDCSAAQVAVDLFLLNAQYSDLATLSGISKFSAGTVYHLPLFNSTRPWQVDKFKAMLTRYLTRKIGFEAVMRVRCTRGVSIHTFHGNFFVRSTDLLSLPNVSPDAGFGMQLSIDEALSDLQQVCFQAALLYTSSKGERRIRVHTMAIPIASTLTDILHHADQQCIIGLLTKMAVDRCISASLTEAREALMTVAVDFLSALRLALHAPNSPALLAPRAARLLPLLLHAAGARPAFRTGTSTRLDDRVSDMCALKCLPLRDLIRALYPDLYALHTLRPEQIRDDHDHEVPRLQLSAERLSSNGVYLLDDGTDFIVYICKGVSPQYLQDTWGVSPFAALPEASRDLPKLNTESSELLHSFIDKLNDDRAVPSSFLVLREDSPSRKIFTDRLLEDRIESRLSYYEFLQHIKLQVK